MRRKWIHRFWFILPVFAARIILVVAPRMKSPPEKVEAKERAVKVRVMAAPSLLIAYSGPS